MAARILFKTFDTMLNNANHFTKRLSCYNFCLFSVYNKLINVITTIDHQQEQFLNKLTYQRNLLKEAQGVSHNSSNSNLVI